MKPRMKLGVLAARMDLFVSTKEDCSLKDMLFAI